MGKQKWSAFGPLKRAFKKINFLLSFNFRKWRLASILSIASSSSSRRTRRSSFNDRIGLPGAIEDDESAIWSTSEGMYAIYKVSRNLIRMLVKSHVTSCKKPVKALETSLETVDIMVKLGWTEIHQNGQASQTYIFKGSGRLPCRVILLLLNMKLEREGKCKR